MKITLKDKELELRRLKVKDIQEFTEYVKGLVLSEINKNASYIVDKKERVDFRVSAFENVNFDKKIAEYGQTQDGLFWLANRTADINIEDMLDIKDYDDQQIAFTIAKIVAYGRGMDVTDIEKMDIEFEKLMAKDKEEIEDTEKKTEEIVEPTEETK